MRRKTGRQIISPHVRFGASSRGPYANRLGGGMYAKSFNLGCFEYHFVSGDWITLPVTLDGTTPGRIEVTARPDNLDTATNRLIIEGDGGTGQNNFRIWWFATPTGRYMFRAFSGDNIVNPYVEQQINNPQELKFVGRWKATSGGGQFDVTDQDNVTYVETGPSGTSSPVAHDTLIVGINRSFQAEAQWQGVIKDIKLYDAEFNGNLIHWWKIDDNAVGTGAIKDSVGSADGDLIQGSGEWRACTRWQRTPDNADFIAFEKDSDGVIKALVRGDGAVTFERQTEATIVDHEGLVRTVPAHCLRPKNGRIVLNLCTGLVTETITVVNGAEYQLTIAGANNATAVCSGAFTGTLTADGTNRISWTNGVAKTSGSTSLTITVTGTLTEMLLEEVTGQSDQNPSESVSVADHGLNVDGAKAFSVENSNGVSETGVVTAYSSSVLPNMGAF